jgi:hypothetical protein
MQQFCLVNLISISPPVANRVVHNILIYLWLQLLFAQCRYRGNLPLRDCVRIWSGKWFMYAKTQSIEPVLPLVNVTRLFSYYKSSCIIRGIPERDGITSQGERLMQDITASSVQSQHSLNYHWIFFGIPIMLKYNFHSTTCSFNDETEVEPNSAITP